MGKFIRIAAVTAAALALGAVPAQRRRRSPWARTRRARRHGRRRLGPRRRGDSPPWPEPAKIGYCRIPAGATGATSPRARVPAEPDARADRARGPHRRDRVAVSSQKICRVERLHVVPGQSNADHLVQLVLHTGGENFPNRVCFGLRRRLPVSSRRTCGSTATTSVTRPRARTRWSSRRPRTTATTSRGRLAATCTRRRSRRSGGALTEIVHASSNLAPIQYGVEADPSTVAANVGDRSTGSPEDAEPRHRRQRGVAAQLGPERAYLTYKPLGPGRRPPRDRRFNDHFSNSFGPSDAAPGRRPDRQQRRRARLRTGHQRPHPHRLAQPPRRRAAALHRARTTPGRRLLDRP